MENYSYLYRSIEISNELHRFVNDARIPRNNKNYRLIEIAEEKLVVIVFKYLYK